MPAPSATLKMTALTLPGGDGVKLSSLLTRWSGP